MNVNEPLDPETDPQSDWLIDPPTAPPVALPLRLQLGAPPERVYPEVVRLAAGVAMPETTSRTETNSGAKRRMRFDCVVVARSDMVIFPSESGRSACCLKREWANAI